MRQQALRGQPPGYSLAPRARRPAPQIILSVLSYHGPARFTTPVNEFRSCKSRRSHMAASAEEGTNLPLSLSDSYFANTFLRLQNPLCLFFYMLKD